MDYNTLTSTSNILILHNDEVIMNGAHLHLILIHFPIAGSVFSLFFLILGWFQFHETAWKKTALILLFLTALFALTTWLSGEGAEEVRSAIDPLSEQQIEKHEEIARTAAIVALITGAGVVLLAWFHIREKGWDISRGLHGLFLILSLVLVLLFALAGYEGGKISHPEIGGQLEQEHVEHPSHDIE